MSKFSDNPHAARSIEFESALQGDRLLGSRIVEHEYEMYGKEPLQPGESDCGHLVHFNVAVGAFRCHCGALYISSGKRIR